MITTLYLISLQVWINFETFEGDYQLDECQKIKDHIQENFPVTATCVSTWDDILIHDTQVYIDSLHIK